MSGDEGVLGFRLHGVKVWMYAEDFERGSGALMPTPTHAMDTFGFGESYAHMTDGLIERYRATLGTKDDLVPITPESAVPTSSDGGGV